MKTGSLFSGYAGLDMAVNAYFGSKTAWFSEYDPAPSRILAHHWPHVPNLGDITKIDWATIEPVDILTGGFPCQDVSAAGRRAGIREGTRSGLWSYFAEAINQLRPKYVVIENVTGLLSADGEPWPPELVQLHDEAYDSRTTKTLNLIERTGGYAWGRKWNAAEIAGMVRRHKRALARFNAARRRLVQRAIGTVVGELAACGYDAQWVTVAAADVGACHRRERVFIVATPADAECGGFGRDARAEGRRPGRGTPATGGGESGNRGEAVTGPARLSTAVDMLKSGRADEYYNLNLLPTGPRVSNDLNRRVDWGPYEAAIRRQERVTGRAAPNPTEPNRNGRPRLSAEFASWMMMLPDGWVTDPAIGLSRNEQLKALGNGVVPAQAFAALSVLVSISQMERAA